MRRSRARHANSAARRHVSEQYRGFRPGPDRSGNSASQTTHFIAAPFLNRGTSRLGCCASQEGPRWDPHVPPTWRRHCGGRSARTSQIRLPMGGGRVDDELRTMTDGRAVGIVQEGHVPHPVGMTFPDVEVAGATSGQGRDHDRPVLGTQGGGRSSSTGAVPVVAHRLMTLTEVTELTELVGYRPPRGCVTSVSSVTPFRVDEVGRATGGRPWSEVSADRGRCMKPCASNTARAGRGRWPWEPRLMSLAGTVAAGEARPVPRASSRASGGRGR